jgi:biotin carboxylase
MKKEKEPPGANTELRGKTLLIVHTCTPKKKFVLQRLKKLGVKIVMLHFQKDWAAPFVDHWIISDLNNHKESIQQVEAFLKENKDIHLDGIVTFWEESVLLTSKLTDNFKLIGIPYSISRKTRNKFLFRQYCESIGLKTPKHAYIKKREDIDKIASHLSFPIVLKPVFGSSSAFVIKVDEEEDVAQTYDYIKKNITSHPDSAEWDSLDVYAEEYIDGEEVDIDMIIQNGKLKFWSMSDNYKTNEPFFVETGQSIPTSLPQGSQERLVNMAEETLEKLGIQNGVIHFEAKIDNDIPVPIEVNIRMGGDEVHSFVKGAWGVDLVDNAAKIACGVYIDRIQKSNKAKKFITGTYFLSPHSGILVQLDIDEKKIKKHSVEEFHFYKKNWRPGISAS